MNRNEQALKERLQTCQEYKSVALDLSNLNLEVIPAEVFEFEWLEFLDLSHNMLDQISVDGIRRLSQLNELNLSHNQFTFIPTGLTAMFKLQRLNLSNNQITAIPELILDLEELVELNLSFNQLITVNILFQLSALIELYLSDNEIYDLPKNIHQAKSLQVLDLSNNNIEVLPQSITQLEALDRGLQLNNNPLQRPPLEVALSGMDAILAYFGDLKEQKATENGRNFIFAVAVEEYNDLPKLWNAVKDTEAIIQVLAERYEFEQDATVRLYNDAANGDAILNQLNNFAQQLTPQDNLLFLLFGHGTYQQYSREGYFMPYGVKADEFANAISQSMLIRYFKATKTRHILLISNVNLGTQNLSSRGIGFKRGETEDIPSRWLLTANSEGELSDGSPNKNSSFTGAILQRLRQNDKLKLYVSELIEYVVAFGATSTGQQTPLGLPMAGAGHEGGEFVFHLRENTLVRDRSIEETVEDIPVETVDLEAYKQGLKTYIAENRIEQLLGTLQEHILPDSDLSNEAILLLQRYRGLQRNWNIGILQQEDYSLQLNRLSSAVLYFIDDIQAKDLNLEKVEKTAQSQTNSDQTYVENFDEEAVWRKALEQDTIKSYQEYLDTPLATKFSNEAARRIKELQEEARRKQEAEAADQEAWESTQQQNSYNGYLSYTTLFPDGKYIEQVKQAIAQFQQADDALWKSVKAKNTIPAIQRYISETQIGTHTAEANALIQRLEREAQTEYTNYEAKLIFVGNGRVGKTSLSKVLTGVAFDPNEPSTHGIRIKPWTMPFAGDQELKLNIWDFGGQEIFHATHRFFLTTRSLYLLIWDAQSRKDALENPTAERNFPFEYWLNNVKTLSKNSPVLMVQNKIDLKKEFINQAPLAAVYNIKDFLKVSAAQSKNIDDLKEAILEEFERGEDLRSIVRFQLPASWVNVRKQLETLAEKQPYVESRTYKQICEEAGLDQKSQETLAQFLHDVGVILYFTEPEALREIIILNSIWATQLIYKILNNRVAENNGRFTKKDLAEIWASLPGNQQVHIFEVWKEQSLFLDLMQRFEICFQLKESDTFVAPQFLSKQSPTLDFDGSQVVYFGYVYELWHKAIIMRVIVKLSEYAHQETYWKNGILILSGGTKALVQAVESSKTIQIKLKGSDVKGMLNYIIRPKFEAIHEQFIAKEIIPCASGTAYFEVNQLIKDFQSNVEQVRFENSDQIINIEQALGSILDLGKIKPTAMQAIKMFISYAHDDEEYKEELMKQLSPLKMTGKLDYWEDRMLRLGDRWNDNIKRELEEASIIMLLVSPNSLSSGYINSVELKRALERCEQGEATLVPVILTDCYWHILEIGDYQVAPKDGKPIDSRDWNSRNQAYLDVVKQLDKLIDALREKE